MTATPRPLQDPILIEGLEIHEVWYGANCYGWQIRELPDGWYLDVEQQICSWRIVETDRVSSVRRGWMYESHTLVGLMTAIVAALDWEWSPDTEPQGWIRADHSYEYRHDWSATWLSEAIERIRARAGATGLLPGKGSPLAPLSESPSSST